MNLNDALPAVEVPAASTAPADARLPVRRADLIRLSMRMAQEAANRRPVEGNFEVRGAGYRVAVGWEWDKIDGRTRWSPVASGVFQLDGTPRPDLIEAVQTTMAEYWPPRKVRRRPDWPR